MAAPSPESKPDRFDSGCGHYMTDTRHESRMYRLRQLSDDFWQRYHGATLYAYHLELLPYMNMLPLKLNVLLD